MKHSSGSESPPSGGGIVIDLGTGDGTFVYRSARQKPDRFFIGIDANRRTLEKISEKIHRKPARGGLPNALFLRASVEDLPRELYAVADEVHVHFPWGSLLRAVAAPDPAVMRSIRRLCAPDAILEVVIGIDPLRDQTEIERLGLAHLSVETIDSLLAPRYAESGFAVIERGVLPAREWSCIQTVWAKRLKGGDTRAVHYLVARAC